MLDGFRVLGLFLGGFMLLAAFAPSGEPLTITDIVFFTLFGITGLLLILPNRLVSNFNMAVVLGIFTLSTFLVHCFVLFDASASFKGSLIILLMIYPTIVCNVLWHHKKSYNKFKNENAHDVRSDAA